MEKRPRFLVFMILPSMILPVSGCLWPGRGSSFLLEPGAGGRKWQNHGGQNHKEKDKTAVYPAIRHNHPFSSRGFLLSFSSPFSLFAPVQILGLRRPPRSAMAVLALEPFSGRIGRWSGFTFLGAGSCLFVCVPRPAKRKARQR